MTMPFFMPTFKNIFRSGLHFAFRVRLNSLFSTLPFQLTTFGNYLILPSPELHHYAFSDIFLAQARALSLQNVTIFIIQEKRVDFSEVTGVRALFFRNLSVGETALPRHVGAMRRG
jgi:hypothetical protein